METIGGSPSGQDSGGSFIGSPRRKRLSRVLVLIGLVALLWHFRTSLPTSALPTSTEKASDPLPICIPAPPELALPLPPLVAPAPVVSAEVLELPPLLLKTPSPAALHNWRAIHQAWPNPLNKDAKLEFDSKLIVTWFPSEVQAGHTAEIVFRCLHEDVDQLCPEAYRVWFEGPTVHSPLYTQSEDRPDLRTVKVQFNLKDPGEYRVFAWPEHDKCDQWQGKEIVYNKRLVGGSPRLLTVTGNAPKESSKLCTSKQPRSESGRWISKAHLNPYHLTPASPYFEWLSAQLEPTSEGAMSTVYSYIWAPFQCKIPHNSMTDWINVVKPTRMIIFGDSLLRDLFCLIMYRALGGPSSEQCDFYAKNYHMSNKHLPFKREDDGVSDLHFVWLPQGNVEVLNEFLVALPTPPTHVLFGAALHLATQDQETYTKSVGPAVRRLGDIPGARTLIRTSGGVVQAIQCYDRIGGQRFQMEDLCDAMRGVVDATPGVDLFDVYPTLNDRPEATPDGRHWANVGRYWEQRPEVGAAEFALLDAMFHSWAQ